MVDHVSEAVQRRHERIDNVSQWLPSSSSFSPSNGCVEISERVLSYNVCIVAVSQVGLEVAAGVCMSRFSPF